MLNKFKHVSMMLLFLCAFFIIGKVNVSAQTSVIEGEEYTGLTTITNNGTHHYYISYSSSTKEYSFHTKVSSSSQSFDSLDEVISAIDTLRYNEEYGAYAECILEFNGEIPSSINLSNGKYYITGFITTSTVNGEITIMEYPVVTLTTNYEYAPEIKINNGAMVVFDNFKSPDQYRTNTLSYINIDSSSSKVVFISSEINLMNYRFENSGSSVSVLTSGGIRSYGKVLITDSAILTKDFLINNERKINRTSTFVNYSMYSSVLDIGNVASSADAVAVEGKILNYGTLNIRHDQKEGYENKKYDIYNEHIVNFEYYNGSGLESIENVMTGKDNSGVVNVNNYDPEHTSLTVTNSINSKFSSSNNVLVGTSKEGFTINYTDGYLTDTNKPTEIVSETIEGTTNYYHKLNKLVVNFVELDKLIYIDYNGSLTKELIDLTKEHYDIKEIIIYLTYSTNSADNRVNSDEELYELKFTHHVNIYVEYDETVYTRKDNLVTFVFPEEFNNQGYIDASYDYELGLGKKNSTFVLPRSEFMKDIPSEYLFVGWSFDSVNGTIIANDYFTINDQHTLGFTVYLCYKNVYTITFDDEGLKANDTLLNSTWPSGNFTVVEGNTLRTVKPSSNPERRGYTFECYAINDNCINSDVWDEEVSSNLTITAKWNLNTYTVTYNIVDKPSDLEEDLNSYIEEKHLTYTAISLEDGSFAFPELPGSNTEYFSGWYLWVDRVYNGSVLESYKPEKLTIELLKEYRQYEDIELYTGYEPLTEIKIYYEISDGTNSIDFTNVDGFTVEGNYAHEVLEFASFDYYDVLNRYSLTVNNNYIVDFFYIGPDSNYDSTNSEYTKLIYDYRWNTYAELLEISTAGKVYIYTEFRENPFENPVLNLIDKEMDYQIDDNGYEARATMTVNKARAGDRTWIAVVNQNNYLLKPFYVDYNEDGATVVDFTVNVIFNEIGEKTVRLLIFNNNEILITTENYSGPSYQLLKKYTYHEEFEVTLKVVKKEVATPTLNETTFYYDGKEKTAEVSSDYLDNAYIEIDTEKSTLKATDIGNYYIYFKLKENSENVGWNSNIELQSDGSYKLNWKITKLVVAIPTLEDAEIIFDNVELNPGLVYDKDHITISSDSIVSAKDVGNYTITLSLKDGGEFSEWEDTSSVNSKGEIVLNWRIYARQLFLPDILTGELVFNNDEQSFEVDVFSNSTTKYWFEQWGVDHTFFENFTSDNYSNGKFIVKGTDVGTYTLDLSWKNDNVLWRYHDNAQISLTITPYLFVFKGAANLNKSFTYNGESHSINYSLSDVITNAPNWIDEVDTMWYQGEIREDTLGGGSSVIPPRPITFSTTGVEIGTYTIYVRKNWYSDNVAWATTVPVEDITLTITASAYYHYKYQYDFLYNGEKRKYEIFMDDDIEADGITINENTFTSDFCVFDYELDAWVIEATDVGVYTCKLEWVNPIYKWENDDGLHTLKIYPSKYAFQWDEESFLYQDLMDINYRFSFDDDISIKRYNEEYDDDGYDNSPLTEVEREFLELVQIEERLTYGTHENLLLLKLKDGYEGPCMIGEKSMTNVYISPIFIDVSDTFWLHGYYENDLYYTGEEYNIVEKYEELDYDPNTFYMEVRDLIVSGTTATDAGTYKLKFVFPNENYVLSYRNEEMWTEELLYHDSDRAAFNNAMTIFEVSEDVNEWSFSYIWKIKPLEVQDVYISVHDIVQKNYRSSSVYYKDYHSLWTLPEGYIEKFTFSKSQNGPFSETFPYEQIDTSKYYKIYFKYYVYNADGTETTNIITSDEPFVYEIGNSGGGSPSPGGPSSGGGISSDSGASKTGCAKSENTNAGMGDLIMIFSVLGFVFIRKKFNIL